MYKSLLDYVHRLIVLCPSHARHGNICVLRLGEWYGSSRILQACSTRLGKTKLS